jgi:hypothetical protein
MPAHKKPLKEKLIAMPVWLKPSQKKAVEKLAKKSNITQSLVIRNLIEEAIM